MSDESEMKKLSSNILAAMEDHTDRLCKLNKSQAILIKEQLRLIEYYKGQLEIAAAERANLNKKIDGMRFSD